MNISEHHFYIGLVIFSIGLFINIQSDQILLIEKKRKGCIAIKNEKGDARSKYVIPTGGLFEYVSCANYCKQYVYISRIIVCTCTVLTWPSTGRLWDSNQIWAHLAGLIDRRINGWWTDGWIDAKTMLTLYHDHSVQVVIHGIIAFFIYPYLPTYLPSYLLTTFISIYFQSVRSWSGGAFLAGMCIRLLYDSLLDLEIATCKQHYYNYYCCGRGCCAHV